MRRPSRFQIQKERLLKRWLEEDYPGGTPRFQLGLLTKDIVIFGLIPISAIFFYKLVESSIGGSSKTPERRRSEAKLDRNEKHSQIIHFQAASTGVKSEVVFAKRSPGTLVRVRLMNIVETYSNAPVHVQVVDYGLGQQFMGATIIGDATPQPETGRISINFNFVRHPSRLDIAVPISARAISLDGTFGLNATKKEGIFARGAIRSVSSNPSTGDTGSDKSDFKTLVARAVAAGLMQEIQSEAGTAQNKAQVLTLKPMTEFFVELTDYFPGQK